ncbi:MAG: redox-sensing transcriptional repressor Rex [Ornithinimicrobium sp.]
MSSHSVQRGVPDAAVARLPAYRRALIALQEAGASNVASRELAAASGVHPAQLRKDLSYLGSYGVRGVGYDVPSLYAQITAELGLTQEWPVAIVGMGNLGRALVAYGGFYNRGFRIDALVDDDPAMLGEELGGQRVQSLAQLKASGIGLDFGVITTPAPSANAVAEVLVSLGVHSILNFAAITLDVPDNVGVRRVDLSTELEILAFHAKRRGQSAPPISISAAATASGGSW